MIVKHCENCQRKTKHHHSNHCFECDKNMQPAELAELARDSGGDIHLLVSSEYDFIGGDTTLCGIDISIDDEIFEHIENSNNIKITCCFCKDRMDSVIKYLNNLK